MLCRAVSVFTMGSQPGHQRGSKSQKQPWSILSPQHLGLHLLRTLSDIVQTFHFHFHFSPDLTCDKTKCADLTIHSFWIPFPLPLAPVDWVLSMERPAQGQTELTKSMSGKAVVGKLSLSIWNLWGKMG